MATLFQMARRKPVIAWWRIGRAWQCAAVQWAALLAGLAATLGVAATAASQWRAHSTEAQSLRRTAPVAAAPAPPGAARADFAASLGDGLPSQNVIAALRRACESAGVALTSLQINETAAGTDRLGRLELSATLRGPYAATRQALAEVLERFHASTVSQLRMRRAAQPGAVDTVLVLSLWSAPAASAR